MSSSSSFSSSADILGLFRTWAEELSCGMIMTFTSDSRVTHKCFIKRISQPQACLGLWLQHNTSRQSSGCLISIFLVWLGHCFRWQRGKRSTKPKSAHISQRGHPSRFEGRCAYQIIARKWWLGKWQSQLVRIIGAAKSNMQTRKLGLGRVMARDWAATPATDTTFKR